MSATINGNNIALTRGDTLRLEVEILDESGEIYTPGAGDVVRFAMKRFYSDAAVTLEKIITDGVLLIEPADTKGLPFGTYFYDIQLTTAAGVVDTFIPRATFEILSEVD